MEEFLFFLSGCDEFPISVSQGEVVAALEVEGSRVGGFLRLGEQGPDIPTVGWKLSGSGVAGQLENGGHPVHDVNGMRQSGACGQLAGPVGEGGNADPAFVDRSLSSAEGLVDPEDRAGIIFAGIESARVPGP